MNRLTALALLITTGLLHEQTPGPKTTTVQLNGHAFTIPDGFTIELAAKAPLVDRPVSASFDEQGRLYVTVSSGSNARGPQQAEEKSHHIVRLEDADRDGVFDKSSVFADKIAMPQGALWHQGSLYVATPPQILKLTDADDDGKAEKREVWHQGTVTGCMNDLHGPWLGPDGWIYWTKGAWQPQTYMVHGKEFNTRACHIFRARPDGSGLEPVMTGGMDNPVGLAFTPTGERIVSGTFFQFPGDGKRDGLIHAIYGGIYGKDHDPIHDPIHKWTCPHVLPIMTHLGAAAPCGMTRFESPLFGSDYRDNLFCCLFNMQKVTRHLLIPNGGTYKTQDFDFVVSDQKDFHPTDVVEDADGSLLVIDTGGWYKICCPTSQLVKPDVLGAIYRVRKIGAPKLDDPLGKKIDWQKSAPGDLCKLLDDPRVFVKRRAIATLGEGKQPAASALQNVLKSAGVEARHNALWAAGRVDVPREFIERGLKDKDPSIVQAALAAFCPPAYVESRKFADTFTQRMAVDALALHVARGLAAENKERWVAPLIEQIAANTDPYLEHSLIHAVIRLRARDATLLRSSDANPRVRRAVLIALDQMDGGKLEAQHVLGELDAKDAALREAAWWIASRRPEWGPDVSQHLKRRLLSIASTGSKERSDLVRELGQLAKAKAIQDLLAEQLLNDDTAEAIRIVALQAMAQANLKETPESWMAALQTSLTSADADVLLEAAVTTRMLRLPKNLPAELAVSLRRIGDTAANSAVVRLSSLAAIPGGVKKIDEPLYVFLRKQLVVEQPLQRSLAAEILSKGQLDSGQLIGLTQSLKFVSPMELDRLLDAFVQSKDEKVGEGLVAALQAPNLRPALRVDMVKTRLAKFSPAVQKQAEPLYAALNADLAKQQARLEDLLGHIKEGNITRGQVIFNNQKLACVVCHSMGYLGGKVGPDLTRIGGIRTERDLLEAIVFPSASFVRSYEPVLAVTTNGITHNGLVKKDSTDELILTTGPNQEVRLQRDEIEEIQPSHVSVMPAGLDQQLSVRDLADLVAFLKACK